MRALRQWSSHSRYLEDLLEAELAEAGLRPADRALAKELTYGTFRWQATLDWLIARRMERALREPVVQLALRLGLYQLFWLDRIPAHAAVNEAVDLVRLFGCESHAGLVNAVLRGYLREAELTRQALAELRRQQPALGYSHPGWLVERWTARYGQAATAKLLEWNNSPALVFARVNALRGDPGKLLEQWRNENVEYDFGRWDWVPENQVFRLKAHPPLGGLPSFLAGHFYVQDPSTLLAAYALDARPGQQVLDLCAAPGGKTMLLAQFLANEGKIVAADRSRDRLRLLEDNCRRLGATCVQPTQWEATAESPLPAVVAGTQFDRVLVDAPCSNTGVIRRRPDVRWRLGPEELAGFHATQVELLRLGAARLRPGGRLVYSTCSFEPEENHEVVNGFLAAHVEFELVSERLLRPFVEGVDGAYAAVLRRVSGR